MTSPRTDPASVAPRRRAPSQRALQTRARVLDAAERIFAQRGFDGATIRDIATEAAEPLGTIHHHGGGKEALFHQVVARRAETLAARRQAALDAAQAADGGTVETLVGAFVLPFVELTQIDPRWQDYARLVAYVSADQRWQEISATCFDPMAGRFIAALQTQLPEKSAAEITEAFVFVVSAMLAVLTSQERLAALGASSRAPEAQIAHLIAFCAAGLRG